MLRPFYFQPGKAELIQELLEGYLVNLRQGSSWFGPRPGEAEGASVPPVEGEDEPPTSLLFALMTSADHYNFIGETQQALDYINEAIEHTPTLVELYSCKARIYKNAGDAENAADLFEHTRSMDLADRYLNTRAVRAMFSVDRVDQGVEKALLFSREPSSKDAVNLHDMQCMWYESALGRSYMRQKNYGKALKMFHETSKHLDDIHEDQFDFHNYCLRKSTLKAYVAMLRLQDSLYSHKFYRRAAKDTITIYIDLFDQKVPKDKEAAAAAIASAAANGQEGSAPVAAEGELTAAEKKRLKHKKKRENKQSETAAAAATAAAGATGATNGAGKPVDTDPHGAKLLLKDPMEEASKIVKTLVRYCSADPTTHILTYDVFSRQAKWLHCLQALVQLFEHGGRCSTYYKMAPSLAHFCFAAELDFEAMSPAVRSVILSEMETLFGDVAFENINDLRKAATVVMDELEQKLKTANGLALIEVLYTVKALKLAGRCTKTFLESWTPSGAQSIADTRKFLGYLKAEFGIESAAYTKLAKYCADTFPLMSKVS